VVVVYVYPRGGGGDVYRVEEEKTKKLFILKGNTIYTPPDPNTIDKTTTASQNEKQEEEEEKKQKKKQLFEELIGKWKEAMKKSENIVKYIDHWYDKEEIFSYILMEYCSKGDLSIEISKRKKENKKFTQQVLFFSLL
jgi:serine/threonine protein kinase